MWVLGPPCTSRALRSGVFKVKSGRAARSRPLRGIQWIGGPSGGSEQFLRLNLFKDSRRFRCSFVVYSGSGAPRGDRSNPWGSIYRRTPGVPGVPQWYIVDRGPSGGSEQPLRLNSSKDPRCSGRPEANRGRPKPPPNIIRAPKSPKTWKNHPEWSKQKSFFAIHFGNRRCINGTTLILNYTRNKIVRASLSIRKVKNIYYLFAIKNIKKLYIYLFLEFILILL